MEEENKQLKIIVTGFIILSLLAFSLIYADGKITGNVSEVRCLIYLNQLENPGRFQTKPPFGEEYWFQQNCLKYLEKKERPIIENKKRDINFGEVNIHEEGESTPMTGKRSYNVNRGKSSCIYNPEQPIGSTPHLERQTNDPYSRIISVDTIKNDLYSIRCSLFNDVTPTSSYN